ncbi:hypothetical protein [Bacillus suaedaesalsae]|uniref:Spore coat protein n=1 Tax=Bacillus suaedaesalsae TaxID=2810349 RepID=A0ABS2DMJ0_9BACI|nr:hypothetical protein [Bacillus suaedaesalsae]MBM6619717.1 hypothetical protein [Bacillus suaedaesalsae]
MNHYYGYYDYQISPYMYSSDPYQQMYAYGERQIPSPKSLDLRLTALEKKFDKLEKEVDRLNKENNRQNVEFTRMNREISRINNEIIRLNRNDERHTRQHNRFNQRLRTVENQLNIPYSASDDQ